MANEKEEQLKSDILFKLTHWFQEAEGSSAEKDFRTDSETDYKMYAGDQDSDIVKKKLAEQDRPATVFNEVKPKVDALIGVAGDVQSEFLLKPVGAEDAPLAEVLNSLKKKAARTTGFREEDQECQEHAIKGGRSLLWWFIDKENPFRAKIRCTRKEGQDFWIDPNSRKYDLSDARYIFMGKWLSADEIKAFYPEFDPLAGKSTSDGEEQHFLESPGGNFQEGHASGDTYQTFRDDVTHNWLLLECWYREWTRVVWFLHPDSGKPEFLSLEDFQKFRKIRADQGQVVEGIERPKQVVRYAIFTYNHVFEFGATPYKGYNKDHFPCTLYGAYRNDVTNQWFSPIKSMRDPQKSFNTTLRQLVVQLQTLPKGILAHETGAVLDIRSYEQFSASPNFHLELQEGGLQKIKFFPQPQIPAIYERLLDQFQQLMKNLSSVQDPLLAIQTSSREPGITAQMRERSNIVALFQLLNNMKKSRIHAVKQLVSFIQQYISDEDIQRTLGAEVAPLLEQIDIRNLSSIEFDLETSEGLNTATLRLAVARTLQEFAQQNPGAVPPDVIMEYLDLPYSAKVKVAEHQAASQEAAQLQADRDYELELLKLQVKAEGDDKKAIAHIESKLLDIEKGKQNGGQSSGNQNAA